MKRIGIVAHSAEGGALCFITACREGQRIPATTGIFADAIRTLAARGADCAILGCTEIPLIVNDDNSPLPVLDSTRLLAGRAVEVAIGDGALNVDAGWVRTAAAQARQEL